MTCIWWMWTSRHKAMACRYGDGRYPVLQYLIGHRKNSAAPMSDQCKKKFLVVPWSIPDNCLIQRKTVSSVVLFHYQFHIHSRPSGNNSGKCFLIRSKLVDGQSKNLLKIFLRARHALYCSSQGWEVVIFRIRLEILSRQLRKNQQAKDVIVLIGSSCTRMTKLQQFRYLAKRDDTRFDRLIGWHRIIFQ